MGSAGARSCGITIRRSRCSSSMVAQPGVVPATTALDGQSASIEHLAHFDLAEAVDMVWRAGRWDPSAIDERPASRAAMTSSSIAGACLRRAASAGHRWGCRYPGDLAQPTADAVESPRFTLSRKRRLDSELTRTAAGRRWSRHSCVVGQAIVDFPADMEGNQQRALHTGCASSDRVTAVAAGIRRRSGDDHQQRGVGCRE